MPLRFLLLVPVLFAFTIPAAGQAPDKEALAQRLVQQSANVREGDLVLIHGAVRDIELLENIAVQVRKAGAFPLLTAGSDRLTRKLYTDVPASHDSRIDPWNVLINSAVDVIISIDVSETDGALAGIPPERVQRRARANLPANDLIRARDVRVLNLGNGMYPTASTAGRLGVSEAELAEMFWKGVNTDPAALADAGKRVRRALDGGRELQITNPNGTDVRIGIANRAVAVSDGVITREAMKSGEKTSVWLPAGEAFLTPAPGTAEGVIVVPNYWYQGKAIEKLTITVKDGRVVHMTAASGFEPLRAAWEAAPEGRDLLGVVDFGLNPNVKVPANGRFDAWVPAGMVTLAVGNDTWAGGENNVPFGITAFLPGSTVKVDGKAIVENGAARF